MCVAFDSKQLRREFEAEGFAVSRGFFDADEAQNISHHVDRYIREVLPRLDHGAAMYDDPDDLNSVKQIPDLDKHDQYFEQLLHDQRLVSLAELLLGDEVRPIDIQWFDKLPGKGAPTPPHQDGFYFMLDPNEAVTVWVALDEVDENNGCMRYVCGSHLQGLMPHARTKTVGFSQALAEYDEASRQREVAIPASPGDVLAHHSLTVHLAGGNTTQDRHRRAIHCVYYARRAKQDAARFEAYQDALRRELSAGRA